MRPLPVLEDFAQDEELRSFAGTAQYETRIHVDNPERVHWLDLGSLHCVSELEVKGYRSGFDGMVITCTRSPAHCIQVRITYH